MKFDDFKIFKFSTISKLSNRIIGNVSKIGKSIKTIPGYAIDFLRLIIKYIFSETNKIIKFFVRNSILKIYKIIDIRKLDFNRIYNYLDIRRYNFYRIDKKIRLGKYKYFPIYFLLIVIFSGFIYLVIPTFYNYDKSRVEKIICKNQNIKCLIKGEVNYRFYPTPRLAIKDLTIEDPAIGKKSIVKAKNTSIKISLKNLLIKKKQNFKKIAFNNFEIIIDLKKFKKYKNTIVKEINFTPTTFSKGKIIFFDENNYVATINDANLNLILNKDLKNAVLKGKFLDDKIYFSLNNKKNKDNDKVSTEIVLKISELNLLSKANFSDAEKNKDIINGNILIKKDKHKFTGIFNYKNNEITINKSNLRNVFLDGKLEGAIKISPYFNFNLDLSLNSINFTKLYNHFLALDEKKQKNLFKINNKINGKLSLSSEKIYSSYNLIKSFESRLKFNNGNILIEQFLINMGKLGAADVLGAIDNSKKFTNLRYESNVFVDNQKKFLSKFGVYNKKSIPSNLFISGNFDFQNIKKSFYEISNNKKFSNEDVNFIEEEFNASMLEDNYESLFRFPKFKEFIKSITGEMN